METNQHVSDLNFKSVLNFRDIGGIPAGGSKKIREGMIYRSANPDNISKDDLRKLQNINVRTIIDLRSATEKKKRKRVISNIGTLSLPLDFQSVTRERMEPFIRRKNSEEILSDISNSLYLEIADATMPLLPQVLDLLLSPESSPVLIHCQAGKDRTGILCALILLSLGVERQFIIDDFMKSNDALLPYFRKTLLRRKILSFGFFPSERMLFVITVKQRNIESVIDRIEGYYGGITAYLQESGFDIARLEELKGRVLLK
jgi:protein-tyrosine phosphatase